MNKKTDRHAGCLLGLAVGDAVGTTLEFTRPGEFEPISDMVGGGPFFLQAGQWTDDTSMALCLAESLIECDGFNIFDQANRYLAWYRHGHLSSTGHCFDIGATTKLALEKYEKTGKISGARGKYAAGNGSLMRIAPIAIAYSNRPGRAMDLAQASSVVTHDNPVAKDACIYFTGLLVGALNGVPKRALLSPGYRPWNARWEVGELVGEIASIAYGSFKEREPKGTGYVVDSLNAALWAFWKSSSFEEGCLLAANLGQDADTTAAIYGQLAGAYYGKEGIPGRWLERLAELWRIKDFALKLMELNEREIDYA